MWGDIAIAFLLAFITSFVATPYTIKFAHLIGAVDEPKDMRRVNTKAIPRLGGLAVIAGFLISMVYLIVIMSIEKTINLFGEELLRRKTNRFFSRNNNNRHYMFY